MIAIHIAIFTISKKKIYLDLDNKTNKIIGYFYKDRKKEYLKIKDIISFTKELFNQTKQIFIKNNRRYFNDAENKENRVDFSIIEKISLKTLKD